MTVPMMGAARVSLPVLGLALACLPLAAKDLFVAPGGTPAGPGTLSSPYDLATALSGRVGGPSDTFWLRGGNYRLGHVNTTVHGAPGRPVTFRQAKGEQARIDGSISIFDSIGYVVFRDFELYSSDTNRVSAQTGVGFKVTDLNLLPGFNCFAPNLSFINLVVHDQVRHGIYLFEGSTNTLVYGCLVYNNGWVSPDNAEGHGLYVQGAVGAREIADNIVFNNSGANMHVYENAKHGRLVGVTLEGNVAFNAGALQKVRRYRDWVVGVDSPAEYADGIVLKDNMGYEPPGTSALPELQVGRESTNGSVVVMNNYMPLGLQLNNWHTATVSGNLFAPAPAAPLVTLNQRLASLHADWRQNTYVGVSAGRHFLLNSQPRSFSEWQGATGFDEQSTLGEGKLTGTRVFVRPNRYEQGRANIIVYNWDGLDNVPARVGSLLPPGAAFEVRNAEDFFGRPALSGIFDGRPLQLPMTNLTVAVPNGPLATPAPTGPTFNVFVLLPRKTGG